MATIIDGGNRQLRSLDASDPEAPRLCIPLPETNETDGVFFSGAFDALPARVIILDSDGFIVFANQAWRASSYNAQKAIGSKPSADDLLVLDCPVEREKIRRGIDSVHNGISRIFRAVYRRSLGEETQWHGINVSRFGCAGQHYVLIADEDVADGIAQESSKEMQSRTRTVQENERQRIAIGLHDSTAQHLTAIGLNLMALKERSRGRRNLSGIFRDMEKSLDYAQREVRVISYLLHPPELENGGLRAALTRMVKGFSSRAFLRADSFVAPAVDAAPIEMQLAIFRIVQEALSNVHRHAAATYVRVRLAQEENRFALSITDNGKGFATSAPQGRSPGLGLAGMRSRVAEFGGKFRVSTGSKGTTIAADFPLTSLYERPALELADDIPTGPSCAPPKTLLVR